MFQIVNLLTMLLQVYTFVIFIYIIMSWIPGARDSQIGYFFARITEPYLEQFRKIIPPLGMIDISPIVAIFVLQLASRGLVELVYMFY